MKEKISLLLELEDNDFGLVLDELRHISKNGYKSNYVIDMYEVGNFCYPLGTRPEDTESLSKSIDYIADEQYVYQCLFGSGQDNVFFLDEYVPELFALKKLIHKTTMEAETIEFKLADYKKQLEESESEVLAGDIQQGLEKITNSLSLIADQEAIGIAKMINFFKGKKVYLNSFDLPSSRDFNILKTAFNEHKGSAFTNEYYDLITSLSHGIDDTDQPQFAKQRQRSNDFRDARVIDRLTCINNFLKSSYEFDKTKKLHLVYYFSSSNKSGKIFTNRSVTKYFPVVDGRPFNPLRTKRQLFLKYLCAADSFEESESNINSLKHKLNEIKRVYGNSATMMKSNEETEVKELVESIKFEFNKYREYFENDAVLNKYAIIKQRITEIVAVLRTKAGKERYIEIAEAIQRKGEATQEREISKLNTLDFWEIQTRFNFFVKAHLGTIDHDANISLGVSTGSDRIRGTAHHLPLLLEFHSEPVKEACGLITHQLVYPKREINVETLMDIDLDSLKSGIASDHPDVIEEKILKAFILLLAPKELFPNEDVNLIACNLVKKLYDNYESASYFTSKPHLVANAHFFIGWALRRANDISQSIDRFKYAIEKFPDDPRFYHGLALSLYCNYYETNKEKQLLEEAIRLSEIALSKYVARETLVERKWVGALVNMIAYLHAVLHEAYASEGDGKTSHLSDARKSLNALKEEEGDEYTKYPEYLHTEATIEFAEYQVLLNIYLNSKDIDLLDQARQKIIWATGAIIEACAISDTPKISVDRKKYNDLLRDITSENTRFMKEYFPKK